MSRAFRTSVARRRRTSARMALYASLVLVGSLLVLTYLWMQPNLDFGRMTSWAGVDWQAYPEVRMLQEYVRIDTSAPPAGDPVAGIRWLESRLLSMGLVPVVEEVGDEANLWAILEGDEREAVVLHSHVDVDPVVHLEAWEHDPFSGTIDGPWLFGRGAFDMKSVTVAQLSALQRLLESGRRPRKSVIFLATTGEEVGSALGTRWMLHAHPELVERFGVVLTEGGAVEGRSPDDLKYWGTEVVQKRLVDVVLCGPRERLTPLEQELRDGGPFAGEPKLVPEVALFLRHYAPTRDLPELAELLDDPAALLRDRAAFEALSPYVKSFFRNQLFPQRIKEVAAGGGELHLRAALLPGEEVAAALEELLPPWRRHGLAIAVYDEGGAAAGSPPDHPAMTAIAAALHRQRPEVVHGPLVLTLTATDARFFRAAGIPTYGFSPFGVLTPHVVQLRRFGTVNERMSLIGYVEGVELYGDVLERLAS